MIKMSSNSDRCNINPQVGTSYTVNLTDAGNVVTLNNASSILVTVPSNTVAAFPVGARIDFIQKGTGKVTFVGSDGVIITSMTSMKSIAEQHVGVSLIKEAINTWYLIGNLVA